MLPSQPGQWIDRIVLLLAVLSGASLITIGFWAARL